MRLRRGLGQRGRAASIAARIAFTASARPTNTAWLTIEWPMLSSSHSGMAATGPTFSSPFPIPANPALTGFMLFGQGLVLGPAIPNPFGGITSNGLELKLGTQ